MAACRRHGAPIVHRGAGTSLAGQCCNVAVVIDASRHLTGVLGIDPERRTARVLPGTVLDDLRGAALGHGLTFGPDPATHAWCTVGGMIGNNSCGVHSLTTGRTSDNVEELEVLTYDGLRLRVGATPEGEIDRIVRAGGRRGEIYRRLRELRDRHAGLIRERFPRLSRRVSGFNLDDLLPERGFHVARALAGTEGTCVTFLEATVRLHPAPRARVLVVLGYEDVVRAAESVPEVLREGPIGLEGMDRFLVDNDYVRRSYRETLALLPPGNAWMMVEFGGETREEALERARRLASGPNAVLVESPAEQARIWQVREAGVATTSRDPRLGDGWPGWEDSAVPPERFAPYLRDLLALLDRHGYGAAFYGHFGEGCLHARIDFDFRSDGGNPDLPDLHGGGGGPGGGPRRLALGGARRRPAARRAPPPHVRRGAGGRLPRVQGDLGPRQPDEPRQEGRSLPARRRPPAGAAAGRSAGRVRLSRRCRELLPRRDPLRGGGPVPQGIEWRRCAPATGRPATRRTRRAAGPGSSSRCWRGRWCATAGGARRCARRSTSASPARGAARSARPASTWPPTRPSSSIITIEGRLRPRAAYAMGLVPWWARLASRVPGLANGMAQGPLAGILKKLGGIHPERQIPAFAGKTFRNGFAANAGARRPSSSGRTPSRISSSRRSRKPPSRVLEAAGHRVAIPRKVLCCGRPLYDFGMLDLARRQLRQILEALGRRSRPGFPWWGWSRAAWPSSATS